MEKVLNVISNVIVLIVFICSVVMFNVSVLSREDPIFVAVKGVILVLVALLVSKHFKD